MVNSCVRRVFLVAAALASALITSPSCCAEQGVYKAELEPHWLAESSQFWYRNELSGGVREYWLVDAEKNTRAPAFDHERLAQSLSAAADKPYDAAKLDLNELEFADGNSAVQFVVDGDRWTCDLRSYECAKW